MKPKKKFERHYKKQWIKYMRKSLTQSTEPCDAYINKYLFYLQIKLNTAMRPVILVMQFIDNKVYDSEENVSQTQTRK